MLGGRLGGDVERAVGAAMKVGAVFPGGGDALAPAAAASLAAGQAIFRNTLAAAIRDIAADERGRMIQRFLRDGPYETRLTIP